MTQTVHTIKSFISDTYVATYCPDRPSQLMLKSITKQVHCD